MDNSESDGHAELRFTFYDSDESSDDGTPIQRVGRTELNVHMVDTKTLIDALLLVARKVTADHISESMFSDTVPNGVRNDAADVLASEWLRDRLRSNELSVASAITADIPDDASELFE